MVHSGPSDEPPRTLRAGEANESVAPGPPPTSSATAARHDTGAMRLVGFKPGATGPVVTEVDEVAVSFRPERLEQLRETLANIAGGDTAPASLRSRGLVPSSVEPRSPWPLEAKRVPASAAGSVAAPPGPSVDRVRSSRLDALADARESAARRELPLEQLRRGARGLGWMSAAMGASLAALLALGSAARSPGLPTFALLAGLFLSVATCLGTKLLGSRPRAVAVLGLAYLLLLCLALGFVRHAQTWEAAELVGSWSPVTVAILLYAGLVPRRPSHMLAAGSLSALMDPLALFLQGMPEGFGVGQAALLVVSPALGAGVAYLSSRLIYDLSSTLAQEREIGSYRLVERLGTGAMGEVWRADHALLARAAAIKLIHPRLLGDENVVEMRRVLKLFELEAQATAALTSAHTIEIYDFGVTREGAFYYVMQLLDGFDTQALVERHGRQPPERVAHILQQAAESLEEAHGLNYVHRDLKPANIFLCRSGGDVDFVKLLDFGLVLDATQGMSSRRPNGAEVSEDERPIGTPSVMAPEMYDTGTMIDGRADIYALGCVAYWLLTGERVFPAKTREEMRTCHLSQVPQAPSERARVAIPEALERLVLACLEKNPANRPQSAREISERVAKLQLAGSWGRAERTQWWDGHANGPLGKRLS